MLEWVIWMGSTLKLKKGQERKMEGKGKKDKEWEVVLPYSERGAH